MGARCPNCGDADVYRLSVIARTSWSAPARPFPPGISQTTDDEACRRIAACHPEPQPTRWRLAIPVTAIVTVLAGLCAGGAALWSCAAITAATAAYVLYHDHAIYRPAHRLWEMQLICLSCCQPFAPSSR